MCVGSSLLALDDDEDDCTNDRDEIEGQVHDIADDGAGGEALEGLGDELA